MDPSRTSGADDPRAGDVATVLEVVTVIGRLIAAQRRAPFGGRQLTRSQIQTLFLLSHSPDPMTPSRLAQALDITAGAVTQLIDGLRVEGLVEATANPGDARSRILSLSPEAATEVRQFESDIVDRLLPRFAALGDAELATLARLLRRVVE